MEDERKRRRRERNKIAAAKCRNKKKEKTECLQKVSSWTSFHRYLDKEDKIVDKEALQLELP